jgi:hypothetical protein
MPTLPPHPSERPAMSGGRVGRPPYPPEVVRLASLVQRRHVVMAEILDCLLAAQGHVSASREMIAGLEDFLDRVRPQPNV